MNEATKEVRGRWGSQGNPTASADKGPSKGLRLYQHVDDTSFYLWADTVEELTSQTAGAATQWAKLLRRLKLITSKKTTILANKRTAKATAEALRKMQVPCTTAGHGIE